MEFFEGVFQLIVGVFAGFTFFVFAYYLFYVCTGLVSSKFGQEPQQVQPRNAFLILIPAHNEEEALGATLAALSQLDYPKHLYQVCVLVDHSTDRTLEIAQRSNVHFIERKDFSQQERGKGFALRWFFTRPEQKTKFQYDACVILDADTAVDASLLQAFNASLQKGARIVQAVDGLSLQKENWLTFLAKLSDILQFKYYYVGREALKRSCKLHGNGMCFRKELLDRYGWRATSLTENWEEYLLYLTEDVRIVFNPRAVVRPMQVTTLKQGRSQKERWMRGKKAVIRQYIPKLFAKAFMTRDAYLLDALLDFLNPSLSYKFVMVVLVGVSCFAYTSTALLGVFIFLCAGTFFLVCLGILNMEQKVKATLYLATAPVYILWKLWQSFNVRVSGAKVAHKKWVRTARK